MDDDELLTLISEAHNTGSPPVPDTVARFARVEALAELRKAGRGQQQASVWTFRMERRLANAAASGGRVLEGRYPSRDGRFITAIRETEEGRLMVSVHASEPFAGLVRVSWTIVDNDGVGERQTIVTPLAATRDGWSADYDFGTIKTAAAVDIDPAEAVTVEGLDETAVEAAFSIVQHGSARRAWQHLLATDQLPENLTAQVVRLLG